MVCDIVTLTSRNCRTDIEKEKDYRYRERKRISSGAGSLNS